VHPEPLPFAASFTGFLLRAAVGTQDRWCLSCESIVSCHVISIFTSHFTSSHLISSHRFASHRVSFVVLLITLNMYSRLLTVPPRCNTGTPRMSSQRHAVRLHINVNANRSIHAAACK
jgi:hypothetical protein